MALIKNDIPILEYDDTKTAVIMPNRHGRYHFPEYAVFPFLGDEVEHFAKANNLPQIGEFISATKLYPVWEYVYKGKHICLSQAPVGAAAAVQNLDSLISGGCKKIISAGSCGVLVPLAENEFLIPSEALRCEGASYHYLPPSRTVNVNEDAIGAIQVAMGKNGVSYQMCKTWSTDGFFRETKDMVEYRKAEGFSVVEMECSALCACAEFRSAMFGMFFYTADSLACAEAHDDRGWGKDSLSAALKLCLDAVVEL